MLQWLYSNAAVAWTTPRGPTIPTATGKLHPPPTCQSRSASVAHRSASSRANTRQRTHSPVGLVAASRTCCALFAVRRLRWTRQEGTTSSVPQRYSATVSARPKLSVARVLMRRPATRSARESRVRARERAREGERGATSEERRSGRRRVRDRRNGGRYSCVGKHCQRTSVRAARGKDCKRTWIDIVGSTASTSLSCAAPAAAAAPSTPTARLSGLAPCAPAAASAHVINP